MFSSLLLAVACLLSTDPPMDPSEGVIRAQVDAPVLEVVLPALEGGPVVVSVLAGGMVVHLDCSQSATAQRELNQLAAHFYQPRSWQVRGAVVKASGRLVSRPSGDGQVLSLSLVVDSLRVIPGE